MATGDRRGFPITRPSVKPLNSSVSTGSSEPCWLASVGTAGSTGDPAEYGIWIPQNCAKLFERQPNNFLVSFVLFLYKTACVFVFHRLRQDGCVPRKISISICISQHSDPGGIAKASASTYERQVSAQTPLNIWIISTSTFLWFTKFWQLMGKNPCAMLGDVSRLSGVKPKETYTLKSHRGFWRYHSLTGK